MELAGRDLFLDTSSSLPYIDPGVLRRIISKHGTDRIMFGSDYPLRSPREDWPLIEGIPWLSGEDKAKIRGLNCAGLLGI